MAEAEPATDAPIEPSRMLQEPSPDDVKEAIARFERRSRSGAIHSAEDYRTIGALYASVGQIEGADRAFRASIRASRDDPELVAIEQALADGDSVLAQTLLDTRLVQHPNDLVAMRLLAELARRTGRDDLAEDWLERALALAPGYLSARFALACHLQEMGREQDAFEHATLLVAMDGQRYEYRNLKAALMLRLGEDAAALALFEELRAEFPQEPRADNNIGHAAKSLGRMQDSVAAFRSAIKKAPTDGEAYANLADLKTYRFDHAEIAAMRARLADPRQSLRSRVHFGFALGKACEDACDFAEAFLHYAHANRLKRSELNYDARWVRRLEAHSAEVFTPDLFANAGTLLHGPTPIFIVGMPRAGSTLVEQILASHSLIEATMELGELPAIARRVAAFGLRNKRHTYPELLAELPKKVLANMGQSYVDRTAAYRRTERPLFIDKLPNNFAYVGLIRLILPTAKVIDVRRHPLACGFSCFKQHFARGYEFSYDLTEIGAYYRDYCSIMGLWDMAAPAFVHRIAYEDLIADLEGEVTKLLHFIGIPFESSCLSFDRTERAVRTASAIQVRQPLYKSGLEHWRHFEPWLSPLKEALQPMV